MDLLLWVFLAVLVWLVFSLVRPARMERLPRRVRGF